MKNAYVYIVGDTNRIKIGISTNPEARIKSVRKASGVSDESDSYISPLCSNARKIELLAHKRFQSNRINGEWFEVNYNDAKSAIEQMDFQEPVYGVNDDQSENNENMRNLLHMLHLPTLEELEELKRDLREEAVKIACDIVFGERVEGSI